MAANSQYSDPGPLFGLAGDYLSTGAPGSPGTTAAQSAAALATVPITEPMGMGALALQPGSRPVMAVSVGDTSAYSSDDPTPVNPLLPDADGASSTGAGAGSVAGPHHPNAGR